MDPIYSSGAAFYNEGGEGKVYVSSTEEVTNLNSEFLQGRHAVDFLRVGTEYGLSQDENNKKVIGSTGVTYNEANCNHVLDTNSVIKIGNIVIKSSDNGDGLLVGIEKNV